MASPAHGFTVGSALRADAEAVLYRGQRRSDGREVLLKAVAGGRASAAQVARLRHEYSVLRSIDSPGVVRALGLEDFGDGLALVLEHVGEQSLDVLVGPPLLDLSLFLRIAVAMAESVEAVHRHHVIHKDIRPHNFFRNLTTGGVTLLEFAAATHLALEDRRARRTERLEGTLAYMSPEQTGRMNRSLDRRTDLYSLGVAFYQLLTGALPFRAEDPLELVHSHIARLPPAPNAVRRDCPQVLSEIILRLLAKNADDRYQDVAGLKADLLRCQRMLDHGGPVESFPLGEQDFSDVLRIPQRLYGRETELALLEDSFRRACAGGAELLLVSGDSGVGKSVLVGELQKHLAADVRLVTGKFDPIGRRIPYAPIAHVCGEMLRAILGEPPALLARWRQKLGEAVGSNGRVVADIVPELTLLLGEQAAVEELDPTQTQHRFEQTFLAFLQAFAAAEHPLVFFLDDVQWADIASLRILRLLMTAPHRAHLLCIGAYRENEVDAAHPLTATLEELRAAGTSMVAIHLGPLPETAVCRLLAETFATRKDAVRDLGQLVLQKTQGNPFFLEQFLRACERDRHIAFVPATRRWVFDLRAIGAATVTDNVVDLMVERLRRLPPETQELLRFAACVGHEFDRRTLTLIGGRTTGATRVALWPALREGLVLPVESGQAYLHEAPEEAGESTGDDEANPAYRFLHDRVHQAAYAMLDERRRQEVHLGIGRLQRADNPASLDDRRLFSVVNHLNLGSALMIEVAERRDLARLNFSAACRAKDAAAHAIAVRHVETCLALLGPAAWTEEYETAFPAEICRAECHIATGQCDDALAVLDRLDKVARDEADRASAMMRRVLTYTSMNRMQEGIASGMRGAAILGMPFPETDAEIGMAIGAEFGAFFATLGPRPLDALLELPPMTEPRSLLLLQILHRTMPSATIVRPSLMALIVARAVHLSLRQGNTPLSSYFCVAWAMLQIGMGEVSKAQAIARIGMELSRRFGSKAVACANHFIMGGFVAHWTDGPTAVLEHLRLGVQTALEVGEVQYVSYCSTVSALVRFLMGHSLETVAEAMRAAQEMTGRTGDVPNQTILRALHEVLALLEAPARAAHRPRDVETERTLDTRNRYVISSYFYFHAMERYLAGEIDSARSCLSLAIPTVPGNGLEPELTFFDGLLLAERARAGGADAPDALAGLKTAEATLARYAAMTPPGFAARRALLAALRCAVEGDTGAALDSFQRSIASARADQAVLYEALANELAGDFAERRGWRQLAGDIFFRNASEAYARWGSSRKASELANRASGTGAPGRFTALKTPTEPWSGELRTGNFDAIALAKATQAISSEIVLAKLMGRLMQTTIEVAGAERGVLLLSRQGEWWVECAVGSGCEGFTRRRYEPHASEVSSMLLPRAVIDFVTRSREKLLLDSSPRNGRLADDPYLSTSRPQSILCMPLIRQGQLVAILYLENRLASDVFSADQVDLLELLSTQAAISLENARLYEEMEERVRERTRQLEDSLRTIRDNQAAIIEAERRAAVARLESELALARRIQTSIVPHELTAPGMEIAALMRTASEVGGDYYDIIPTADGGFWLGIGDVSGHGLSAGLSMLMLQSGLSTLGHSGAWVDPAAVLSLLNRTLYENIRRRLGQEDFVTLSLFRFFADGRYLFAGAHEDVLLGHARTRTWEQIPTRGTWLGVAENIASKTVSREGRLEEGDVMVLFTDGVIEARRQRREQFGIERVIATAVEAWGEPSAAIGRRILDNVAAWSAEVEDDQTVVVLRRCATRLES